MLTVCCIAIVIFAPSLTRALEMQWISGEDVTVQYPESLRSVAQEVVRLYPSVKTELEKRFDDSIKFNPTIILIQDRDDFQRIAGTLPVVALAVSDGDQIIIDNSRMKTYPFTLTVTLKHELCHLFLHHIAGGGNLPRWFNEGIAQWTSDGIAEIIVGERKNLLRQAVLSKRLIPLAALTRAFPEDQHSLVLAYEQSRSVIGFLSAEYGPDAVVQTLKHIESGCDIECALQKGVGLTLPLFEEKWHASLKRKVTWFTYVSAHLYQILFIFAAFVLTAGFFRMLLKKRRYKDEDDAAPDDDQPV